jgi:antitoxin VapB
MALNIKDPETERLAEEVAAMTGESKTGAIRQALAERRQRLAWQLPGSTRREDLLRFLEREVWPLVPRAQRGKRLTRREEDRILGYGREGV